MERERKEGKARIAKIIRNKNYTTTYTDIVFGKREKGLEITICG
jgi:hypothetical protein